MNCLSKSRVAREQVKKSRKSKGFTLVELLIVIAIIGILTSIALPLYQNWVIRSRVSEGVLALSQCRQAISEVYQMSDPGTTVPADGWSCGEGTTQTNYVSVVNTDTNGVVTVTFRNIDTSVDGSTIEMVPQNNGVAANIASIPMQVTGFVCSPGSGIGAIDEIYVPGSCR